MNLLQLIDKIISEWAYRVNDGMPDVKNPTHVKELGIVLSEMGLSHIKNDLVENLLTEKGKTPEKNVVEADKNFKNPILNKSVKYKNAKGEDSEGLVGNLLRLPKEHPGRQAAERMLPPEGSEERDSLNKDLGGEGQPTKPEDEKGKEGGGEEAAPKEDPIQKAAPMFDPKLDPAMGHRLDKEKETLTKLADTQKEREAEAEKELKPEKETGDFNPIPAVDVQNEIPEADPDTFGGESDIPNGIDEKDLQKFNTDISKVQQIVADAKAKGEKAPNINLCQITVPGTNLYCDDNLGIPRAEMPQFKGKPQPGTPAAEMEVDKDGEVDTEPLFKKMLKEKGITVSQTEVPADKLKATQSELVGAKVVGMMGALEENPQHEKITAPIYVSRDGYVIDGHHRWAAIAAYNAKHPDSQIPMKVQVIDQDIKDAIPMCNKFAEEQGVAAKKADANAETPKEQPKESAKLEPANDDPKSNAKKFKGETSGKEIQTIELEGGGQVFGTVHRNTKMVDDIINQVKNSIPKEKWKDIVFVGEGGATNNNGELEFHDEMDYAAPKFKELGAGIDTFDGDELDVHEPNSKLYQKQLEKTGLNQSQVNAGNWASMIGQGEGTDTMQPSKFLDDEGKNFLQNAAKEAGFPPIENWDEPTEQDKDTLYRLSFPEDNGDKETKINDIQVAFNEIRDENLIEKSKELAAKGKIPITIAGEGHIDLVDKMMKPKQEMKEELFPMIDSLIEGIIAEFIREANPKAKATPSKEHPGYYHRGGGYYSKQPDGEITHKSDRGTFRALTAREKAEKNKTAAPPVKGKKPAPKKTVAQDKDLQARVGREKAALNKDKKTATATTPKPKAAPSGKISNKMEEDDVFFSKKKVQDKLKDVNTVISKLPMTKDEKKVLFGIVGKALRGEELTKAERRFASDWVTFPATSDPKIYFAPAKGEFKTHIKVELGKGIEDRDSFNEYLERNEIFDAGHAVRKKSMVASNLTRDRKPIKVEGIEKDKDGKTQSCRIGNTVFKRYPEPDEKELLDQFKKRGIINPEEEVRKTLIAIKRHNEYVEFIASQEDIETIDFGYDTDTADGRKNTIESIKKMMFNKLNADFGKFFKGKIPPDAKNILNLIKNISNPYNGISPERMQEEIDAIAKLMNANPEFRAGVPDMQEIFDFMVKLGQGYAGFMPSASNWKVTDIVTYKPSQEIKMKKDESPAEAIANNFQNIISTSLIEGGLSVKYEKGGASAGYDKVLMTRYRKHKNFDTQKEILTLFDTYKWSFTPGEENRVKSKEEIDAKEEELNSVLERAKKAGILTEEQITEIQMEGEEQAARMAAKVEKKIPFKNFKQCFGKTDKEQKANYENYKRQCGMWCKMGAIAEALNNNDMDYQLFGNLRTVYPKKGEPRHETIDGVTTLSGMGWSYDPGIAATGKECKYLSLNNANSSHIEPISRK